MNTDDTPTPEQDHADYVDVLAELGTEQDLAGAVISFAFGLTGDPLTLDDLDPDMVAGAARHAARVGKPWPPEPA